jgi:hypothetical protein
MTVSVGEEKKSVHVHVDDQWDPTKAIITTRGRYIYSSGTSDEHERELDRRIDELRSEQFVIVR